MKGGTCEKAAENDAFGSCFRHPFHHTPTRASARFNHFYALARQAPREPHRRVPLSTPHLPVNFRRWKPLLDPRVPFAAPPFQYHLTPRLGSSRCARWGLL